MKNSVKKVVKFLNGSGVNTPIEFEEVLVTTCEEYNSTQKVITVKCAEAILKACKPWESYVEDENEFSKLVCSKYFSMAKNLPIVISSHLENQSYIGNVCKLNKKLPKCLTTIVSFNGRKAYIRSGYGEKMKEL